MDTSFCIEAIEEAFAKHGKPEIFNTDQGSQFTSAAFVQALKERGVQISMDGRGCWRDNVFVERLWRTIKYEHVYLRAYDSVSDARTQLGQFIEFYNTQRPHSSLDKKTPDEFYFASLPAFNRQLDRLSSTYRMAISCSNSRGLLLHQLKNAAPALEGRAALQRELPSVSRSPVAGTAGGLRQASDEPPFPSVG